MRRPSKTWVSAAVRPLTRLAGDPLLAIVYVGGCVLIAAGCWDIFRAAGLIAGGLLALVSAIAYARGSRARPPAGS